MNLSCSEICNDHETGKCASIFDCQIKQTSISEDYYPKLEGEMQKWLCPVLLVVALLLIGPFPHSSDSLLLNHFNNKTRAVLARIQNGVAHLHQLHETFHLLLPELGFDPLENVRDKLLPEAVKLLQIGRSKIRRCYEASVGDRQLDIFAESLHSIVHGYFVSQAKV